MKELTKEEVRGLGHAVGLEIQDPELTEVTYSLNALLEDLDRINPPGLETVEPLPILLPPRSGWRKATLPAPELCSLSSAMPTPPGDHCDLRPADARPAGTGLLPRRKPLGPPPPHPSPRNRLWRAAPPDRRAAV